MLIGYWLICIAKKIRSSFFNAERTTVLTLLAFLISFVWVGIGSCGGVVEQTWWLCRFVLWRENWIGLNWFGLKEGCVGVDASEGSVRWSWVSVE